jgi:hypothetical protein
MRFFFFDFEERARGNACVIDLASGVERRLLGLSLLSLSSSSSLLLLWRIAASPDCAKGERDPAGVERIRRKPMKKLFVLAIN